MGTMASRITSLMILCWTVDSGADQRKHQSSASLAFMRVIHQWPVNYPHKGPVTRKMFPFDDVIMRANNVSRCRGAMDTSSASLATLYGNPQFLPQYRGQVMQSFDGSAAVRLGTFGAGSRAPSKNYVTLRICIPKTFTRSIQRYNDDKF